MRLVSTLVLWFLVIGFAHCFSAVTDSLPEDALFGLSSRVRTPFISGTLSGLLSNSIVLQNNGGEDLVVNANGVFSFGTNATEGSSYNITIQTQPTNLRCLVQNGTGIYDGTITSAVVTCPMALFGGVTYMRCTAGQVWNTAAGDCTGTGNSGSNYGASVVQFCSNTSNACNSLVNGGALAAGQSGQTSSLYLACDALNSGSTYGINTWRVASKGELQTIEYCDTGTTAPDVNGDYVCNSGNASPTVISGYFPNTVLGIYSSGTADGCCPNAYWTNQYTDGRVSRSGGSKTIPSSARCVSP